MYDADDVYLGAYTVQLHVPAEDEDDDNDDDEDEDEDNDDDDEDRAEREEAEQEEFASLIRRGVGHCLPAVQNASDDMLFSVSCFSPGIELHPGQVSLPCLVLPGHCYNGQSAGI